uniref:PDC2 n=1 Tax=Arundo donax TaxID=35708 RepID=A0A0A9F4D0_ARUDO
MWVSISQDPARIERAEQSPMEDQGGVSRVGAERASETVIQYDFLGGLRGFGFDVY